MIAGETKAVVAKEALASMLALVIQSKFLIIYIKP